MMIVRRIMRKRLVCESVFQGIFSPFHVHRSSRLKLRRKCEEGDPGEYLSQRMGNFAYLNLFISFSFFSFYLMSALHGPYMGLFFPSFCFFFPWERAFPWQMSWGADNVFVEKNYLFLWANFSFSLLHFFSGLFFSWLGSFFLLMGFPD